MFAGLSDRSKLVLQLFFVGMLCAGAYLLISTLSKNSHGGGFPELNGLFEK